MIRALYLVYQICIALPIMIVMTILVSLATMIGSIFNDRFWGYWPGMIWGRLFYLVFLIPVKIDGLENIKKGQSYVIAANHQSYWDAFLVYGFIGIKFKWMMKKELGRIPFVGWACKAAGCIFIDRSSRGSAKESIRKAESKLKNGMSVVIFPEGTRSKTGKVGRGHSGAALIAARADKRIVPVGVVFGDKLKFRTKVTVKYGEPIDPKEYVDDLAEPNPRQLVKLKNRYMAEIKKLVEGEAPAEEEMN